MLTELIYYLDDLLDQEGGGRHRAERVQNTEVSCVRYLIQQDIEVVDEFHQHDDVVTVMVK